MWEYFSKGLTKKTNITQLLISHYCIICWSEKHKSTAAKWTHFTNKYSEESLVLSTHKQKHKLLFIERNVCEMKWDSDFYNGPKNSKYSSLNNQHILLLHSPLLLIYTFSCVQWLLLRNSAWWLCQESKNATLHWNCSHSLAFNSDARENTENISLKFPFSYQYLICTNFSL